ncbi:hypothetical protein LRQ04_15670 [Paenarthrobacter sp. AR 02]|nr:hypothetical protein [Paenarthrobacter sp. AR 02]MCF3140695.1 hypothetical protein [Paenarthrobacter sp. AR 02]
MALRRSHHRSQRGRALRSLQPHQRNPRLEVHTRSRKPAHAQNHHTHRPQLPITSTTTARIPAWQIPSENSLKKIRTPRNPLASPDDYVIERAELEFVPHHVPARLFFARGSFPQASGSSLRMVRMSSYPWWGCPSSFGGRPGSTTTDLPPIESPKSCDRRIDRRSASRTQGQ